MRREQHVRLCEGGGARFPSATRRVISCKSAAEARTALQLYEECGLVNLISLIPSLGAYSRSRTSS
jgi:hypothetical protein